jgi:hypothetical protein
LFNNPCQRDLLYINPLLPPRLHGQTGLATGLLPTLSTSWPFHCEAQSELAELAVVGEVRDAIKFVIIYC